MPLGISILWKEIDKCPMVGTKKDVKCWNWLMCKHVTTGVSCHIYHCTAGWFYDTECKTILLHNLQWNTRISPRHMCRYQFFLHCEEWGYQYLHLSFHICAYFLNIKQAKRCWSTNETSLDLPAHIFVMHILCETLKWKSRQGFYFEKN